MAVLTISVINTKEIAVITNNHSVFEIPKKQPAAITQKAASK